MSVLQGVSGTIDPANPSPFRPLSVTPTGVLRVSADWAADATRPAENAAIVAPNDGADLATPTRALVVGVAGNVAVDMVSSGTNIVITLPAGIWPLAVKRVRSTGTTATGIVALW